MYLTRFISRYFLTRVSQNNGIGMSTVQIELSKPLSSFSMSSPFKCTVCSLPELFKFFWTLGFLPFFLWSFFHCFIILLESELSFLPWSRGLSSSYSSFSSVLTNKYLPCIILRGKIQSSTKCIQVIYTGKNKMHFIYTHC